MLQQTQVERVALKFEPFINAFPDFRSLARPLAGHHGRVAGTGVQPPLPGP